MYLRKKEELEGEKKEKRKKKKEKRKKERNAWPSPRGGSEPVQVGYSETASGLYAGYYRLFQGLPIITWEQRPERK